MGKEFFGSKPEIGTTLQKERGPENFLFPV